MIHRPLIKIPLRPFPIASVCITRGKTVPENDRNDEFLCQRGKEKLQPIQKDTNHTVSCVKQKTRHKEDQKSRVSEDL